MSFWITACSYMVWAGASTMGWRGKFFTETGCPFLVPLWWNCMYNPSELCMILLRATDLNLGASIWSLSKRAMTYAQGATFHPLCCRKSCSEEEKGQSDTTTKEHLPSLLGWLLFRKGKCVVLHSWRNSMTHLFCIATCIKSTEPFLWN